MSTPLKDFRLGITETIDIWLDAEAVARGVDRAVIAREVLARWAKERGHAHRVAQRRMAANGLQPDLDGLELEDAGVSRQVPAATPPRNRR
jgi:pyruvate/2-oxoglutarate dehydrogenase complex dihydrolipoamide dehydrogenase (E3) component